MNIFDCYYTKYDAWYDKHTFVYLSEIEALKKVMLKKGRSLEIGVGTGRFAAPLSITIGIDPSYKMLEIANRRGINVRWGYGEDLPFLRGSFDYVAIISTLCFVNNPYKVLQESRRVLKSDGELVLGIIDKDSFLGKDYQQKKSRFYKKAHFFSVTELENLLKEAGYRKFSYYQTLFTFPEKIQSIEKPRKGYGKGGFVVIEARNKPS